MVDHDVQTAKDWSDMFARSAVLAYDPSEAADHGMTQAQYTDLYLTAFVRPGGQDADKEARQAWFLDVKDHVQAAGRHRGSGGPN
jgi:hypothetical protein